MRGAREFQEFLADIGEMPDKAALSRLLDTGIVRDWAREWAAFEGPFATQNALRVSYDGMLDGSELARIGEFTGMALPVRREFDAEQKRETEATGRQGAARFNRSGRTGEWREWFSEEEGGRLVVMASDEGTRQRRCACPNNQLSEVHDSEVSVH